MAAGLSTLSPRAVRAAIAKSRAASTWSSELAKRRGNLHPRPSASSASDDGKLVQPDIDEAPVVTLQEPGMRHARCDARVQAVRANVSGNRRVEQPAVPARADQSGEDLGVETLRLRQQPRHRVPRPALVDLELRVQLVCDCQIRVQL